MSGGNIGFSREAVRVKVKKCEGNLPPEWRKFSVDPQITSFEVLQSILVKAFELKGVFTIYYRILDVQPGPEIYLPLLSDWDLDAAFLKAYNVALSTSTEPCLCLRIDLKPELDECADDCWELKQNVSIITQIRSNNTNVSSSSCENKASPRLHGIFNQMGKTFNIVQKAFNFGEDNSSQLQPPRAPLSDSEFRKFLDPVGQILYPKELRSAIYFGGIDPSLRKVVWKHILNVYPDGMTGRERMDYIKRKAAEYIGLREIWKRAIAQGSMDGELAYTAGMVRKDVLRTDRHHPFYAGSDDNQNIASLFNILTTYALNHPKVSYCQGMSDIASPLLVTMNDEAHAYICFCALMRRLNSNFMLDGIAMTQKFNHLAEGLMHYDPEFYNYLKMHQADDLLFCYRWLLLEMKREFAFDDSLRMLEVLWSSLPADPPHKELKLYDTEFQPISVCTPPVSPLVKTIRENPYTKVCALRRQSSSISLHNYSGRKAIPVKRQIHSLDENFGRKGCFIDIKQKHQSLDDAAIIVQKASPSLDHFHAKSLTELRPRSVSPHETKPDCHRFRLTTMKSKNTGLSSSMTNLLKNPKKSGHFKELKEKLASNKYGIFSSLEILDKSKDKSSNNKMVKNLNEFLSFASGNKNKICDRFGSINEMQEKPKITLTKSSFDQITDSSSPVMNYCEEYSPDVDDYPMTSTITSELRLEFENFDKKVFGKEYTAIPSKQKMQNKCDDIFIWENPLHQTSPKKNNCVTNQTDVVYYDFASIIHGHSRSISNNKEEEIVSNNKNQSPINNSETDGSMLTNFCEEVTECKESNMLPPPNEFGGGNPFLMFLCITVLLQHRDHIIRKGMDYNEMAMHFDKMVRKHNVIKVLNQARQMYATYIKQYTLIAQHKFSSDRTGNC